MTPLVHARPGATITTVVVAVVMTAGMTLRLRIQARAVAVAAAAAADGGGKAIGMRVAGEVVREEEGAIGRAIS